MNIDARHAALTLALKLNLKRQIRKLAKNPNEFSYIGKDATITAGVIDAR